ncbi:MAG: hypothetical protein COU90_00060 [Candidatus Ryanbacteria bacterium CG10_big_fil_rev_8_21_14_0_10_43_42]|uniref:AB hydrolase-1 domain-containing protein n=1 Tax=Candidatus Ryanbacteria bacterium CG10_big_fil_rev_8_21_14_0_10_43_42 TaxID=1974864 RepID=A0A2M8KYA1_9BACT|nr:MAG: hypothetical protein COU90_00060 [Candidatus Ryanbacteria bacterium CG10_big_fil_rev_8_21_14_0_10_43_42]
MIMEYRPFVVSAKPEYFHEVSIPNVNPRDTVDISVAVPEGATAIIIFCYGGSLDFHRWRSLLLLQKFFKAGYGIAFFDYRGMNASSGSNIFFEHTGLHTRIIDTQYILVYLACHYPKLKQILWGHSMGGHIAACLSAEPLVSRVILSAPGAFSSVLVDRKIPFGENFRKILRQPGSWMDSESFEILKQSNVPLLLFTFEDDAIIPFEVTETYFMFAANKKKRHVIISGEHGGTFECYSASEDRREQLVEIACNWMSDDS